MLIISIDFVLNNQNLNLIGPTDIPAWAMNCGNSYHIFLNGTFGVQEYVHVCMYVCMYVMISRRVLI